jgi:peptide-methionine (S)-S-oxide reductase
MEKATFGAGCFWGVEYEFNKLDGVTSTSVGYMGGNLNNPRYEDVCTNKTGHVEVVQLKYDSEKISYEELLNLFWKIHDPTQMNRQGADIGSQYRSVIFYHTIEQKKKALESKNAIQKSGIYKNNIVTKVEPSQKFWKAEEYHQRYYEKNRLKSCDMM